MKITVDRSVLTQAHQALWDTAHGGPRFSQEVRDALKAITAALDQDTMQRTLTEEEERALYIYRQKRKAMQQPLPEYAVVAIYESAQRHTEERPEVFDFVDGFRAAERVYGIGKQNEQ